MITTGGCGGRGGAVRVAGRAAALQRAGPAAGRAGGAAAGRTHGGGGRFCAAAGPGRRVDAGVANSLPPSIHPSCPGLPTAKSLRSMDLAKRHNAASCETHSAALSTCLPNSVHFRLVSEQPSSRPWLKVHPRSCRRRTRRGRRWPRSASSSTRRSSTPAMRRRSTRRCRLGDFAMPALTTLEPCSPP